MASLADVQRMIKQGDRKRAALILQRVLKENPSADAWYLAARMTKNQQKTRTYLQNALKLDPGHQRSRQALLDVMGQDGAASTEDDLRTTGTSEEKRPRPAWQRFAILGGFLLVIIVVTLVALNAFTPQLFEPAPAPQPVAQSSSNTAVDDSDADVGGSNITTGGAVFPTDVPAANTPTPVPPPIEIQAVDAQILTDHFALTFFGGELTDAQTETSAAQAWNIQFAGSDTPAQVLLYESTDAMAADSDYFTQQVRSGQVVETYHTVAVLYDTTLDFSSELEIKNWLSRLPATAQQRDQFQQQLADRANQTEEPADAP